MRWHFDIYVHCVRFSKMYLLLIYFWFVYMCENKACVGMSKEASMPMPLLELALQVLDNMDAGNQTHVVWKSRKCSYPLSYASSSHF